MGRGEDNEQHKHQEEQQQEGEEVSPGAGRWDTHNTVISINVFSGHRKMLSHSSKGLGRELGHE